MHALPVFPGTILSMGSGFIRLRTSIFLTATAGGSFISALFYLGLGYSGMQASEVLSKLDVVAQVITALLIIAIVAWIIWIYRKNARLNSKRH
jgi:membrane protein DedA with SNARE-associated domain